MAERSEAAKRMVSIIDLVERRDASFHAVCAVIAQVLSRVLATERVVAGTAISLAHQERLAGMCSELRDMVDVVTPYVPGGPQMPQMPALAGSEKSWWYALSEATQIVEDAAEQLSVVVSRQDKRANLRNLAAQAVGVLREHYNVLFGESKSWLDG